MWENGETYKGKGEENLQSGLKPNSSYRLWIISKPMKLEKKLTTGNPGFAEGLKLSAKGLNTRQRLCRE
jgi:hypothetical protein